MEYLIHFSEEASKSSREFYHEPIKKLLNTERYYTSSHSISKQFDSSQDLDHPIKPYQGPTRLLNEYSFDKKDERTRRNVVSSNDLINKRISISYSSSCLCPSRSLKKPFSVGEEEEVILEKEKISLKDVEETRKQFELLLKKSTELVHELQRDNFNPLKTKLKIPRYFSELQRKGAIIQNCLGKLLEDKTELNKKFQTLKEISNNEKIKIISFSKEQYEKKIKEMQDEVGQLHTDHDVLQRALQSKQDENSDLEKEVINLRKKVIILSHNIEDATRENVQSRNELLIKIQHGNATLYQCQKEVLESKKIIANLNSTIERQQRLQDKNLKRPEEFLRLSAENTLIKKQLESSEKVLQIHKKKEIDSLNQIKNMEHTIDQLKQLNQTQNDTIGKLREECKKLKHEEAKKPIPKDHTPNNKAYLSPGMPFMVREFLNTSSDKSLRSRKGFTPIKFSINSPDKENANPNPKPLSLYEILDTEIRKVLKIEENFEESKINLEDLTLYEVNYCNFLYFLGGMIKSQYKDITTSTVTNYMLQNKGQMKALAKKYFLDERNFILDMQQIEMRLSELGVEAPIESPNGI